MAIIATIRNFISALSRQEFYNYLMGLVFVFFLILFLIFFRFNTTRNALRESIDSINEQREVTQHILGTYKQVKKQQAEVDAMLAQDEGFKIGGYFESMLATLNLKDNKTVGDHSHIDHRNNYRESILRTKLIDMNMRQLCELLQALEKNKRIYIKELDITKSKKKHKKIEVTLTIATLEPRSTFA